MSNYFRKNIHLMQGYVPGEQTQEQKIIKLNTNENPYPPSPKIIAALKVFNLENLRSYPNPNCDNLRQKIAEIYNIDKNNTIIGNGSDDILTIITRSFIPENGAMAYFDPSYSLYKTLAEIQGCQQIAIPLNEKYQYPQELPIVADNAQVLFITRPNAPTSHSCCKEWLRKITQKFTGIVVIDEAYADFADDNCIEFINKLNNVIITRTLSKSYSLAGIRVGYALACENLITGMMKVRDSYNINSLSQIAAVEALNDRDYFHNCLEKIKKNRHLLTQELEKLHFFVMPSQANFLFVKPPKQITAQQLFIKLREQQVFTRYFNNSKTADYLRITIGTVEQQQQLIDIIQKIII